MANDSLNDNSKFDQFPPVFNTFSAASTFAAGFHEPRVVVRIGRKYASVTPEFAQRMGLKVAEA